MGIKIEMTGSGELGDITPGWNVQEYATPVIIGDTAGGTGAVAFNAAARDDSLFVINNEITTTEETLGSISGIVKSVSQTGIGVTVAHNTKLALFDKNVDVPPLGVGSMESVMDIASQLSGVDKRLSKTTGAFYSLNGHSAGFDTNGNQVEQIVNNGSYYQYNSGDGKYYPVNYSEQHGNVWATEFTKLGGNFYSSRIYGDSFSSSKDLPMSRMAFKVKLDAAVPEYTAMEFWAKPDDSNTGTGQYIYAHVDSRDGGYILLNPWWRSGGTWQNISRRVNLPGTGIDLSQEIAVFIEYGLPSVFGGTYTMKLSVCNTSNYANVVTCDASFSGAPYSLYNDPWLIRGTGKVRSLYRSTGTDTSAWIGEYENAKQYTVTSANENAGPVGKVYSTNLWQYIQDACSAYGKELAVVNDVITVRNLATRILDVTNIVGAPSISPETTFTGRSVEIVHTNSTIASAVELYNARDDSNKVISVNIGETNKVTVPVNGTPIIVNKPTRSSSAVSKVGEYSIADSKGVNVDDALWRYYGGNLSVEINNKTADSIDIIFTAPQKDTGGVFDTNVSGGSVLYPGPWKLAYSSGSSSDYAALSIVGYGIKSNKKTLKLLTGAAESKTPQDVAKTIANPFISTESQAYDRGIWLSSDASGPRVKLTGTLPVSVATGFGLTAGSRIFYKDSIYRINSTTIGNIGLSFDASRYVLVSDFDAVWSPTKLSVYDSTWNGYDYSDSVVFPLRYIGDNESILMFLDTDVNPYYDFTGDPEISVFQDTDTNPFYEEGGNLDGEDTIKLDTDINPYDEDL